MHSYKPGQQQETVPDYLYNNVRFKATTGVCCKHYVEKKNHKKCVYQGYDSHRENTSELLQLFMISGAVLVY